MKKAILGTFISILIFVSCNPNKVRDSLMANVTGQAGEVVLVIEKSFWEGAIGDSIKNFFLQPQIGLPQPEPLVDLVNIPSRAFTDIFKTHRNIIYTYISSSVKKPEVLIKRDFHSSPQLYISIEAPNSKSFMELFIKNRERILAAILKIEKERITSTYTKYPERGLKNHLLKTHDLTVTIPTGYKLRTDSTDFIWYSYETQLTSQGIFIYYYDYTDTSQLTYDQLLKTRNSYLKNMFLVQLKVHI
jgi:uncharacterized protein DUF4837